MPPGTAIANVTVRGWSQPHFQNAFVTRGSEHKVLLNFKTCFTDSKPGHRPIERIVYGEATAKKKPEALGQRERMST